MKLDYRWKETKKVRDLLQRIEVAKRVIEITPIRPHIEENLRRRSLLKSAVFSARIEGNKLKLEDVLYNRVSKRETARKEIDNINKALNWLYSPESIKEVNNKLIQKLHNFVMHNLSSSAGKFRIEQSGIFNQAGVVIYMPPPPTEIRHLIRIFVNMANRSQISPLINTAACHFAFEKTHPFLDGNGRVGRLISTHMLKQAGYSFRGIATLEEYIDKNRQTYYDLLTTSSKNISPFVEFFLEGVMVQADKAINDLKDVKTELPEDQLLPRRREILEIIRDHEMVSFDFVRRRFRLVSDSTIHYDLRQLIEQGYVKKLGITRGALYSPTSQP
jgi:Fic family protein